MLLLLCHAVEVLDIFARGGVVGRSLAALFLLLMSPAWEPSPCGAVLLAGSVYRGTLYSLEDTCFTFRVSGADEGRAFLGLFSLLEGLF